MGKEKISTAWRKQYAKERRWDQDFEYAAGNNKDGMYGGKRETLSRAALGIPKTGEVVNGR